MMKNVLLIVVSILFITTASAQENRIKVACIGNSITYGYGLPDRTTQSYPAQLQKMLGESYQVENFGKSGATLLNKGHRPYMQQDEYRRAIDFGGDIVVIHLGINDTDPRDWPDYRDFFVKDYIELIDSFRAANSKVRIMIARLTPIANRHPRFLSGTRDWHGEIQLAIENVARYTGVQLIDFHEPLYPYPFILTDADRIFRHYRRLWRTENVVALYRQYGIATGCSVDGSRNCQCRGPGYCKHSRPANENKSRSEWKMVGNAASFKGGWSLYLKDLNG